MLISRLLLSLLALPLLYRALGEEGEGWTGGAPRRVFFALLGAAVFFQVTANWLPTERGPESGRGFQAYVQGMLNHRMSHTFLAEMAAAEGGAPGTTVSAQVLPNLRKAVEHLPQSVYYRRYLGIVEAERGEYEAARKTLRTATDLLSQRAPERGREERQVWETLFGGKPPTAPEIEAARTKLRAYRLGWQADVAALAAYNRPGAPDAPAEARQAVRGGASSYLQRAFSGILALILLPQLGLIVLVVGIILVRTGVLKAEERKQQPVGAILWEGLILLLALGLAPGLLLFGGSRPSPETQAGAFAGLLVAGDLIQLLAVAWVWFRLRARGLTLAEIGLTTRRFWANAGLGVAAACVVIPTAHLVGFLTQSLSERYFPNVAPPYHPLSGLTATTGSLEIRAALFFAAVIGAPFLEEIFFRGALFGALRRRFGLWTGILGSSAFFAILHPQLPLGFLPLVWLATAFALLYEWRQSLVAPMVVHAINNGLAFLMLSLLFPPGG